jgi:ABC-type transport system substrate-binding protein
VRRWLNRPGKAPAAGTVTFHLAQADPDFLCKLSMLFATPAPPGAPGHAITGPPFLPGTGPYKIAQYRPNASVTLVRNPYFRQWSYAAQPAGYPDVIRFQQIADPGSCSRRSRQSRRGRLSRRYQPLSHDYQP